MGNPEVHVTMPIFEVNDNWRKTRKWLDKQSNLDLSDVLNQAGRRGVDALVSATPIDTGLTANSWRYEIHKRPGKTVIGWYNSNMKGGVPIAILIQYGHGQHNGGYVMGRDFINPAIRGIFDDLADTIAKEVNRDV